MKQNPYITFHSTKIVQTAPSQGLTDDGSVKALF